MTFDVRPASSTHDLCRFYQNLLAGNIIKPESLARMQTLFPAEGIQPGMGIFRYEIAGQAFWGHTGFWGSQTIVNDEACISITINQAKESKKVIPRILGEMLETPWNR